MVAVLGDASRGSTLPLTPAGWVPAMVMAAAVPTMAQMHNDHPDDKQKPYPVVPQELQHGDYPFLTRDVGCFPRQFHIVGRRSRNHAGPGAGSVYFNLLLPARGSMPVWLGAGRALSIASARVGSRQRARSVGARQGRLISHIVARQTTV